MGRVQVTAEQSFLQDGGAMGGPPVTPPVRRGFGSRLIERVLPADFGGTIAADYRAEGFALELRGRTDRLTDSG